MDKNLASNIEVENNKSNPIENASLSELQKSVEEVYSAYSKIASSRMQKNCITGDDDYLLNELKAAFALSNSIDIIVSFLMESGVKNGVKACAVVNGEKSQSLMDRKEAIARLNSGEINVIFSVDMFNEGLDVPSIDPVMFLRPTESPTVFLQQLGRGLRKAQGKSYLNALDFIGNYKKANLIPFF